MQGLWYKFVDVWREIDQSTRLGQCLASRPWALSPHRERCPLIPCHPASANMHPHSRREKRRTCVCVGERERKREGESEEERGKEIKGVSENVREIEREGGREGRRDGEKERDRTWSRRIPQRAIVPESGAKASAIAGASLISICTAKEAHRNVKRFRGGLVFKAQRWWYHSTLGSRVIKKKRECTVRSILEGLVRF